jgi:hypothetical protein
MPTRYSPTPNSFWERSSVQKEALAELLEANNRTGVPSSGAEDIGRRSAAIMVVRRRLRVSYANATNESLYISYQIRLHAYCVDSTTALRPAATSLLKRADPFSTISGWLARREELQARPLD